MHEMIIKMRDGYDTQIGEQGAALSAGQAQRVALARALYGDPFLIVLDEPNSNLDTEGDEALTRAVRGARERGAIVIVVAHRPVGIEAVDQLLVLKDGRMQAFGPKETVLGQVLQRVPPPAPIKIVSEAGVAKVMSNEELKSAQRSIRRASDRRARGGARARRRTRRLGVDGADLGRADRAGRRWWSIPTSRRCSIRPAAWSARCACATATSSRPATSSCGSTRPWSRRALPSSSRR